MAPKETSIYTWKYTERILICIHCLHWIQPQITVFKLQKSDTLNHSTNCDWNWLINLKTRSHTSGGKNVRRVFPIATWQTAENILVSWMIPKLRHFMKSYKAFITLKWYITKLALIMPFANFRNGHQVFKIIVHGEHHASIFIAPVVLWGLFYVLAYSIAMG
jgi:hypothetical protein